MLLTFLQSLLLLLHPLQRTVVLIFMQQCPPSLHKLSHSLLVAVDLIERAHQHSRLFLVEHINNLLQLPSLDFLLIDHLPETIHESCLFLQPAVLKLSLLQFLLGGLDAFDRLQDVSGMQERNAGLYVQHFIVGKGHELFPDLIDQDAVAVRVDLFGGRHLLDVLHVFLLEGSLLLALPLGLLVEGLAVHQR